MVIDPRVSLSKLTFGISKTMFKEYKAIILIRDIYISRLMIQVPHNEEEKIIYKERDTERAGEVTQIIPAKKYNTVTCKI